MVLHGDRMARTMRSGTIGRSRHKQKIAPGHSCSDIRTFSLSFLALVEPGGFREKVVASA